jgi:hypothetical protein
MSFFSVYFCGYGSLELSKLYFFFLCPKYIVGFQVSKMRFNEDMFQMESSNIL